MSKSKVTDSLTDSLSDFLILTLQSDPRDLWPLRHLIRVMRRHDLTKMYTYPLTYLPTYLPVWVFTYLREHPQGVILETCDLYWLEWWGDLTWSKNSPTNYNLRERPQGAIQDTCDNWDIWSTVMIWHLGCSLMEQSWGLVTFVTLITILTIENLY